MLSLGLLVWVFGWIFVVLQTAINPTDSLHSLLDKDYWSLLFSSGEHALTNLIGGVLNFLGQLAKQVFWDSIMFMCWFIFGLNIIDGCKVICNEIGDILLGVSWHLWYFLQLTVHVLSFGHFNPPTYAQAWAG